MKICTGYIRGLALVAGLVLLPFASAHANTIQMLPPTDLSSTGVTNTVCGGGNALLSYSASTAQGTAGINCGSVTTDTAGGLALGNSGTLALGSSGLLNVPAGGTAKFGGTTQFTTSPDFSSGADFSSGTLEIKSGATLQADTSVKIGGSTANSATIDTANALTALLSTCNGPVEIHNGALSCGAAPATCTPTSKTQTVSCPSGQTGSITQEDDFTCPSGGGAGSWSGWYDTSNTCTTPAPAPSTPAYWMGYPGFVSAGVCSATDTSSNGAGIPDPHTTSCTGNTGGTTTWSWDLYNQWNGCPSSTPHLIYTNTYSCKNAPSGYHNVCVSCDLPGGSGSCGAYSCGTIAPN